MTKTGIDRRHFLKGASTVALSTAAVGMPQFANAAGNVLKTRSYADIRSMDPAFSQGVVDEEIQGAIYNKLIQFKPGSEWGWQLDAAASIEQVDDTHINFALRDDMGFTNGFGAMTAEDVKYSFERIIDEKLESTNKPDMSALDHVEVTGERTGTIVLKNAFQPLWSITLPYITGNIISKKAFEQAGVKSKPNQSQVQVLTCTNHGSLSKRQRLCQTQIGKVKLLPSMKFKFSTLMMKKLLKLHMKQGSSILRGLVLDQLNV
jgi:peptide/nickel transport system substrate-binding protein